jgi:Xaa-Pro aminopeptidase
MTAVPLDALVVTHPPNISYLTGFAGSAGIVVLTASRCVLIVDPRYTLAAEEAVRSDPELARAIALHVAPRSYDETLLEILTALESRRTGIEATWMSVGRFNRLAEALRGKAAGGESPALLPTERLIEIQRMIKDEGEITTMREAARRLALAAAELPLFVREGRSEREIAADIDALLRRGGFERPAFETIVASGPNSAKPHARPGGRVLERGDGVLLDFGGVYDGYCVDLSRTVQLGAASPEFRRLLQAVVEAQQAALAAVRPGVSASSVDAAARAVLAGHGLADAFGHGTGHGLGLEVHEDPRVGRPVAGIPDVILAPGMVFTIEPGAYVEGVGGARVEDDVLVTDKGCEVLTHGG